MAKTARRKPAKKRKKKSKTRNKTKKKAKTMTRRKTRKAKPRSLGNQVAGAYRTVVDTVKGTDRLRNKLEPPGTSETE